MSIAASKIKKAANAGRAVNAPGPGIVNTFSGFLNAPSASDFAGGASPTMRTSMSQTASMPDVRTPQDAWTAWADYKKKKKAKEKANRKEVVYKNPTDYSANLLREADRLKNLTTDAPDSADPVEQPTPKTVFKKLDTNKGV